MSFLTQGKTNWRYILIVIVLAAMVSGGTLWLSIKRESFYKPLEIKKSEKTVASPQLNLKTTKLATIPEGYKIFADPVFSSDGRKVAYTVEKEDKYFLVINEKEGKTYDQILTVRPPEEHIQFSPDSQKLAYVAKKDDKWFVVVVVVNDKEGTSYDEVDGFTFSPDSQRLAYMAKKEGKWFVVIDDKEGKAYDGVSSPIFSPDSKDVIYTAIEKNKEFIVINEKEGKAYDGVYWSTFSPDSKQLAYIARKENQWFIVVNDVEGNPYDWVSPPNFSPDSKQLAYVAGKGEEVLLVINNKENKGYFALSNFAFSPDGQRVAYIALQIENVKEPEDLKIFLVINGTKNRVYDWERGKETYLPEYPTYFPLELTPIFSPDGQNLAYKGRNKNEVFMVVNNREGKKYEGIYSSIFSPDSKHLAYIAHKKLIWDEIESHWQEVVLVDDRESKVYDYIHHKSLQFSQDSKYITYGTRSGNELWWIAEEVE